MANILRQHAEQLYAQELEELQKGDSGKVPANWKLSPQSVVTYLMGGRLKNGFEVTPKYIGNKRLMEIAVATLTTDRALLLYGLPGTAKSWVSEHLSAAISGDSTLVVQGTAGTGEESIRYGWNSARLLAELPAEKPALQEIKRIVTIFRELRNGVTTDGKTKVKIPSGTLSTAEAISVVNSGLTMAAYFGDGQLKANDLASSIIGAIIKDPVQDKLIWQEYLETVVKPREDWKDIYRACRDM